MPSIPSCRLQSGFRCFPFFLIAALLMTEVLHAAVLVWDTNTGTADAQDGTGTWTAGLPNWFNQTQPSQNQVWVNGSDAVFGAGSGTAGTITLSGPITAGNLTFNAATSGSYTLGGSILTLGTGSIVTNANAAISSVLAGSAGLSKTGAGNLTLSGGSTNTYSGLTTISGGTLILSKTSGVAAVTGDIEISNGAHLQMTTNQQVVSTANVVMSGSGSVFNGVGVNSGQGNVTQTLASLTVTGGTVNAGTSATGFTVNGAVSFTGGSGNSIYVGNSGSTFSAYSLSLTNMTSTSGLSNNSFTIYGNNASIQSSFTVGAGGLALDGSILNLRQGSLSPNPALGSRLVLNGDLTTTGTVASQIRLDASGGLQGEAALYLSSTSGDFVRTFDIGSGGANLDVSVSITNGAATSAGITKEGGGTLTYSGTLANAYSGVTTINAGTLRLNKTAGTTAVAGNIIVNTGGTLQLSASNQIADDKGITLNGGTMTAWGTDETIASFTQNSGGLVASGNIGHVTITGALTLAGGSTLVINSNPGSTNPASWNVGSAILSGADILIGGSNGAGNPRTSLTIGAGGLTMLGRTITMNVGDAGTILNLNGDFTGSGTNNIVTNSLLTVQPLLEIGAASRTFNVLSGTTTVGVIISGTGGSLVKTGAGLMQITAVGTYSGTTTVSGGTFSVAGAGGGLAGTSGIIVNNGGIFQNGSPSTANNNGVTNRINTAATLTLGGGTFDHKTAAAGAHTQDLDSIIINGGSNTVNVTATAGTTATLTFTGANPYVRTSGTVNFVQNPVDGGSIVFTNAPSGAGNVSGGLLVGAILNGTDLIAVQSGVLTAFAGWTDTGTSIWTNNASMNVTGSNPVAFTSETINALRFNTTGAFTLTLDGTHTIDSGMLLVTPTVGANLSHHHRRGNCAVRRAVNSWWPSTTRVEIWKSPPPSWTTPRPLR
jgi:autotransporter-associated beta strand protein